jgi:hypothetical protein
LGGLELLPKANASLDWCRSRKDRAWKRGWEMLIHLC